MNSPSGFGTRLALFLCLLLGASAPASAQAWTQLFPTGDLPGGRIAHSAVYDSASKRMIVFSGGIIGNLPPYNDTWVLTNPDGTGPSSWIQLFPAGSLPSPRTFHGAAYDPASNRMIIFGGSGGGGTGELWVLTHANGLGGASEWVFPGYTGSFSSCSGNPRVTYDAANKRLMAIGACFDQNSQPKYEFWVLANADAVGGVPVWTQLFPSGASFNYNLGAGPALELNYDAASNRLIAYGAAASQAGPFNGVWILTNANGLDGAPEWLELTPAGTPPDDRPFASAVYDSARNRLIVFGGCCVDTGVWVLTHANGLGGTPEWIHLLPPGSPSWRRFHSAIYDASSNRMTVFGGQVENYEADANDVWVLSSANGFTNQSPTANAGADQSVPCASAAGAQVTLDGSASSDPDGDTLSYKWKDENGNVVGTTASLTLTVPLGAHTFTLAMDDGNGGTATDTVEVRVNIGVEGLLAPLAALAPEGGLIPLTVKAFKRGSTLPLKLRMFCGSGTLTSSDVAPPRIIALTLFDDPIPLATIDPDSGEANDNGLLFRSSAPLWVYNLSSRDLATGTYILVLELPDGRRFTASFVLR